MNQGRHPWRGLLSGVLLGLGLMILLIVYAKAPFGAATPWIALVCGVLAGLVMGLTGPPRRLEPVSTPPEAPPAAD